MIPEVLALEDHSEAIRARMIEAPPGAAARTGYADRGALQRYLDLVKVAASGSAEDGDDHLEVRVRTAAASGSRTKSVRLWFARRSAKDPSAGGTFDRAQIGHTRTVGFMRDQSRLPQVERDLGEF